MLKRSTGVGFDLLHRAKAANFSSNRILTKLIYSKSDNVYTSGFYVLFNCIFVTFRTSLTLNLMLCTYRLVTAANDCCRAKRLSTRLHIQRCFL